MLAVSSFLPFFLFYLSFFLSVSSYSQLIAVLAAMVSRCWFRTQDQCQFRFLRSITCLCQHLNNQPFIIFFFAISHPINRVSAVTARPMAGLAERKTSAVFYNRLLVLWVSLQMLHTAVGVQSGLGENTPVLLVTCSLYRKLCCLVWHMEMFSEH